MHKKIAIIGSGLIGRSWAISFARAGYQIEMTDINQNALKEAQKSIKNSLSDLASYNLLNNQSTETILTRVKPVGSVVEALDGAIYVQENTAEIFDVKREVYVELDKLASPSTVIGSSTSGLTASLFTENLNGRNRCLVAHPINPPHLVPAVELCPAPWTDTAAIELTAQIMEHAGHKIIRMKKEIDGFIVNRMQIALLHEAFRLVEGGYASCEDVDTAIKDGLSHRWSFIGPFETGDLNAPEGIRDYCTKFGDLIERVGQSQIKNADFRGSLLDELETQRRRILPSEQFKERSNWRDKRLMALAVHKKHATDTLGD